jgi:hypothetical protein
MSEKVWNKGSQQWEIDGVAVTYRVTWRNIDTGAEEVREFDDVDQGYDFYQMMQRDAHSTGATWEHLPY